MATLQYLPIMRQTQRITSSLSAPLALSSAILVVLLVLSTTPVAVNEHRHSLSPSKSKSNGSDVSVIDDSPHSTLVDSHARLKPAVSSKLPATSSTPPSRVTAIPESAVASGVLSGGAVGMSLQNISSQQSFRWTSDQPLTVSVWDGSCSVDNANHTISNQTTAPCTVELQADSFTTWQLFALA